MMGVVMAPFSLIQARIDDTLIIREFYPIYNM
jgi:hypothetical protein